MFKSYLKIALRNIKKYKGYSFINIAGLAIGMACCVLILIFVQDELSFDAFHSKRDRIYRLNKVVTPQTGGTELHAITSGKMGPTMAVEFSEVEQCVRLLPWFSDVLMAHGQTTLKIPDVLIADAAFFQVFDFNLLHGNARTALVEPLSIILTEETAHKFFGDADAMGQSVAGIGDEIYTVTGIIENPPDNSHLRYNALISWSSTVPGLGPLNMDWLNRWITQVNFTYLLLHDSADAAALEEKFPDFMQRHLPAKASQYHLYLQALSDIYLNSSKLLFTYNVRTGNAMYVYVLSAIALLILLIACSNFMNLATARASARATEVGVRKVLGAYQKQVARQFLGESILISFVALLLTVVLVELALPFLNALASKNLGFTPLENPLFLLGLLGMTVFVGLLSGIYPAFLLARYKPVHILKGVRKGDGRGIAVRKILVVFQFAISIVLLAVTAIVFQQVQFVQTKNLGFQKEQIVVLPIGNTGIARQFQAFKNELLRHPNITHAAGSNSVPGTGMMSFGLRPEGKPDDEDWVAAVIRVDDTALLETYGMEMAAGRYFSPTHPSDSTGSVVINEALAKSFGWDDPVGKRLDISGELQGGRVIGVIKDFHMRSLHHPVEPLVIYFAPRWQRLSLRITGRDIPATIAFLREKWQEFETANPFEYSFLDQTFAQFYQSEQRLMQVFGLFTGLAIFIACLGLLGLVAYTAEQRTKEIGIRKVLGATVANVVALLSKDFVKLVLLANLLAWPVAWFAMNKWLQNFAYRIDIGWWVFVLAGGRALVIALLTVSTQSRKAGVLQITGACHATFCIQFL